MKSTLIKNARIWNSKTADFEIVDVFIEKKHISKITNPGKIKTAETIIEANKNLLIPGLVDLNVHIREPGDTHKATILSETNAAAANSITTLVITPNTTPTIDGPSVLELIHKKNIKSHASQVLTTGALTRGLKGDQLSKMGALQEAGCIAFNQLDYPIQDNQTIRHALEYAASLDMKVMVQPLDRSLAENGCIHEGKMAARLGLKGIPDIAETIALTQWLSIAEYTKTAIHFSHISCKESVELIKQAKQKGLPVTADVSINHLLLTEQDCANFNSQARSNPPLRTERDRDILRNAVNEGIIDIISSAHQPHDCDAKLAPFQDSEAGISGLDLFLPLLLRLVEDKVFSLETVLQKSSLNPSLYAGLNAGKIEQGYLANLSIIDENAYFEVDPINFKSEGKNTPYTGWSLTGKTLFTILKGNIIYKD